MFNRQLVLVAIDQATDLERIIDVALSIAKAREADLHVIQVRSQRATPINNYTGQWPFESGDDRSVNVGARLASIVRSSDPDGARLRSVTLRGTLEHVIPAYAQLHRATLLIVERNYGSSRLWRNGRVVDEIAHRSPMPLLVLPKRRGRERGEIRLRRILAPVDFSIASAVGLRTAVDLSRRHGARLTLLHALKDVPQHIVFSGGEAWEVVRRLPGQRESVARRLRRKAAFFGADDVTTEVATGVVDGAILEVVRRGDADLIVMGVPQRSWLDRLAFGSTLRRVLRRATLPVLAVPVVAGDQPWPDERIAEPSSTVDRIAA